MMPARKGGLPLLLLLRNITCVSDEMLCSSASRRAGWWFMCRSTWSTRRKMKSTSSLLCNMNLLKTVGGCACAADNDPKTIYFFKNQSCVISLIYWTRQIIKWEDWLWSSEDLSVSTIVEVHFKNYPQRCVDPFSSLPVYFRLFQNRFVKKKNLFFFWKRQKKKDCAGVSARAHH